MNLHLFIPALFWPDSSQSEIYDNLLLPALEKLLGKSTLDKGAAATIDAWLCTAFGVEKQQDWPIAPITLQAEHLSTVKNSKDYWIRADPVHLRIEQNHIMLADSHAFDITMEEAQQYTDDLNLHLHQAGLALLPAHPDRWYMQVKNTPKINTYTLNQVVCENINYFLPAGEEQIAWHNIFNEAQMILHEHPLNQARESRGELAINSIWLWGGGVLPDAIKSRYVQIWSDDAFSRALAEISQVRHERLPSGAEVCQQFSGKGDYLAILNHLLAPSKYKDGENWQKNLAALEQHWFMPLYRAVKKGDIKQLTITTIHHDVLLNFTLTSADLLKFWRLKRPISSYIVDLF